MDTGACLSPLTRPEGEGCDFLPLIQESSAWTSRCDYLFAMAVWEYGRELGPVRSPATLRPLLATQLSDVQHKLRPFLRQEHGFPARGWGELTREEQLALVNTFCGPPVLFGAQTAPPTAESQVLIVGIPDFAWRAGAAGVMTAIGDRCQREFGAPVAERRHPQHGRKASVWVAALHRLAFCRLRASTGIEAAREYQRRVHAAGGRTKFGSPEFVRREVIKCARKLFPWLPAGEIPIHAAGPNDVVA